MKLRNRLGGLSFVLLSIMITASMPASAANTISKKQANNSIVNIKSEIKKTKAELVSLKNEKNSSADEAFANGSLETGKLQNDFELLKTSLQKSRLDAVAKLSQLSIFKVLVNNISACGVDFQSHCEMNQTIKIPPTATVDVDFLIKIGGFVAVDEVGYKSAKTNIANLDEALLKAENQLNAEKATAQKKYESAIDEIYKRYGTESSEAEEYLDLLQKCLKAAMRSSKVSSNYLAAFKTAFVYQFNYESIVDVAKTPFSEIDSFISLNVVRNAIKYSEIGDSIDTKYSDSRAVGFNKYFGKTFFDSVFESSLENSLIIYKKFAK